jgi:hypothetical protein
MKTLEFEDITLDPRWLEEQSDRLLGFEVLTRVLAARYQPMSPEVLSDKVGLDKGFAFSVLKSIQKGNQ